MFLTGCNRDDQIVSYSEPKDAAPTTQMVDVTVPQTAAAPQSPRVRWVMPPGWKQVPSDQEMRFATIQVSADHPDVVLTITPLPADATEVTAVKPNVIRWEGQLGLPASDDAGLAKVVKQIQVNGVPIDVIDLTGATTQTPQMRMITAMATSGDKVWFFKLAGRADVVGTQAKNFDDFVRSIQFDTVTANAAASAGGPADSVSNAPNLPNEPAGPPADVGATWTTPSTWTQEPPHQMRLASFKTPGGAEIIITRFPGDVGGLLPNVNRWRGEVGLPDFATESDAKAQTNVQMGGLRANIFDFAGSEKHVRVAMVKVNDDTWFFKLIGPASAVANQQPAFDSFLQSVKFGGDSK
jgi:hypothetical protein